MVDVEFEWDEAKASANVRKHRVSFDEAKLALADPNAIIEPDHSEPTEDRWRTTGMANIVFPTGSVKFESDISNRLVAPNSTHLGSLRFHQKKSTGKRCLVSARVPLRSDCPGEFGGTPAPTPPLHLASYHVSLIGFPPSPTYGHAYLDSTWGSHARCTS